MDEVNTGDITEDRTIGEGINNYGIISKQFHGKKIIPTKLCAHAPRAFLPYIFKMLYAPSTNEQ